MKVLIAEDDLFQAEMLEGAVSGFGYEVTVARDGREAFDLIRTGDFQLLVCDWEMPEMTGIELCQKIRNLPASGYVYIILLTLHKGWQSVIEGLNAGADEFLTKPFHPQELRLRLRTAERVLSLENRDLTIFSLAKLAESRDPETGAHLERIREYSRVIAHTVCEQQLEPGVVDGEYVRLIHQTSPLHDIGKVGIPDQVLLKPGRLTPDEFAIMRQHTTIGGKILDAAASAYPEASFLRMASEIAWTHHERFDGTGYPHGLSATQIPLSGRIVAVADVYDALTTRRIYKDAYSHETARSIIVEGRGSHFDPDLVDIFLDNEETFVEIQKHFECREEKEQAAKNASLMACC